MSDNQSIEWQGDCGAWRATVGQRRVCYFKPVRSCRAYKQGVRWVVDRMVEGADGLYRRVSGNFNRGNQADESDIRRECESWLRGGSD